MPKKKKKEKAQKKKKEEEKKKKEEKVQKKKEETVPDTSEGKAYSLNTALHSVKKTETTLQSLLNGVSEGQDYIHPGEDKEKVLPHLSHESRSKIAEEFMLEDVPLSEREPLKKHERKVLETQIKKKKEIPEKEPSKAPPQRKKIVPPPQEVEKIAPAEEAVPTTPIEKPSFLKKDNIYLKLTEFFEELLKGYNKRYENWENSISNILAILRKMRKITKKNTEDLVESINNIYKKIQTNLDLFKVKRDEVEKVAEVDIESMSGEFKRVLGLLELQIKEYQLKRGTDDLIHQISH